VAPGGTEDDSARQADAIERTGMARNATAIRLKFSQHNRNSSLVAGDAAELYPQSDCEPSHFASAGPN